MANKKKHKFNLEGFKAYVATYDGESSTDNYTDEIIVKDMLYGIGLCLDKEKYEFADGFKRFLSWLDNFIKPKK